MKLVVKKSIVIMTLLLLNNVFGQSHKIDVEPFNKVVISPHIAVTFIAGDKESVVIESNEVSDDKLNIEVKGETLQVYLDDAKKFDKNNQSDCESKYRGTIVRATITYKSIHDISLYGDEKTVFKSKFKQEDLNISLYGDVKLYIEEVVLSNLKVVVYGDTSLEIVKGSVEQQKITCYGDSVVNMAGVENKRTKATVYGDAYAKVNVSDELKVSAFGDANVKYLGNPEISTTVFGDATISKL